MPSAGIRCRVSSHQLGDELSKEFTKGGCLLGQQDDGHRHPSCLANIYFVSMPHGSRKLAKNEEMRDAGKVRFEDRKVVAMNGFALVSRIYGWIPV